MDSLELPPVVDHHTFYLSSCESGTGIDIRDSNVSSRHSSSSSSSSSFSPSNTGASETSSSIHTNMFLNVLNRLHCLKLRRQKHGRYRTLASSLHLFFKNHQHASIHQFFKSPSSPQLTTEIEKNLMNKRSNSHHQLQTIETSKNKPFNIKNRRSLLRRVRKSDKTVSEDNNTNTMSSLDLTSLTPTVLITETTSSATLLQHTISIDAKRVSQLFLCHKTSNMVPIASH
jgi:hypothetical protein